ncbi:MAG: glycosyltransferase [Lachnotalea sp.]
MKITFLCLGSRGDVQPYVAIGKTAIAKGHSVTICTGKTFQKFVEQNGLVFQECSIDLMALLQTKEGKQMFDEGMKHPIKAMKYAKKVVNPLFRKAMTEFYHICKTVDVIVYHPKAFAAVDIAEKLDILCISMPPVPIICPIEKFPNLAITTKNLGAILNKLTYQLFNLGAESNNIKDINDFRENELFLRKRKAGVYMTRRNNLQLPIIYPISPNLFLDVKEFSKEFKNNVVLTGFPILEDTESLDQDTSNFLNEGKKPIVITFSSMPLKDPESFISKIRSALIKTNNRGIILIGNSGIQMSSDKVILFKDYISHDLILKNAKGIVHHGGVGTMAAALRSGKPQVIMPFNVDQPFWAKRLFDLGYTSQPLNEKSEEDEFMTSFRSMDHNEIIQQAEKIAKTIHQEKPNEKAVEQIEQLYEKWNNKHE